MVPKVSVSGLYLVLFIASIGNYSCGFHDRLMVRSNETAVDITTVNVIDHFLGIRTGSYHPA